MSTVASQQCLCCKYSIFRECFSYILHTSELIYHISEGEENSKDLFKVTNTLLHKENSGALPTHSSEKELTNDIGKFF